MRPHPPGRNVTEHRDEELVFRFVNARAERRFVVPVEHGDGTLRDDGSRIDTLVDEVHRATSDLDAVREGLPERVDAGERWQERRVNVEHPTAPRPQERGCENAHEPREYDPLHTVF